jgi:hypothetical protein
VTTRVEESSNTIGKLWLFPFEHLPSRHRLAA